MHNFRANRVDPESQRHNNRVLGEHMDSEHYIRWIYPNDIHPDSGSGLGLPAFSDSTLRDYWIMLPDTGTPGVVWKFARPEQWLLGRVETILYYSNSTNSTANISTTLRGYTIKVGTNNTTMTAGLSQNGTFAGQATAGLVGSFTYAGYLVVTREHVLLSWSLARNVADANTGNLRILAVRHRYIPDQHEV